MENKHKIVFKGKTNKGVDILVRYPEKGDADAMLKYVNELSKEQTFVGFQGEEISEEKNKEYLFSHLNKIKDKKAILLLAFAKGRLIGISSLNSGEIVKSSHVGYFTISVAKDFRSQGIGRVLMTSVLNEAQKIIFNLKINLLGIHIY